MMEPMEIIAQAFGILGSVVYLISFQIKKNRPFFAAQCLGSFLFMMNYLLLGAYTGCLMNLLGVVRAAALAAGGRFRHKALMWGLDAVFVAATVLTFEGVPSLLVLIAMITTTHAMWTEKGKIIRYVQLFISSPCWLAHNIMVFSIGGIICEVGNIISTVISIVRFRKTGYE
ncbi:MAG: YgjV family protein [Clostridia bacterium]|nr:YgjV family protein [Clostridia bacterium]